MRLILLLLVLLSPAFGQPLTSIFSTAQPLTTSKDVRGLGARAASTARTELHRELFDPLSVERFQQAARAGKPVRLMLNLGFDASWPVVIDNAQVWSNGESVTWTGHLDIPGSGSFSLAMTGDAVDGHASTGDGRVFEIRGTVRETIIEEMDPASVRWSCEARGESLADAIPPPAPPVNKVPARGAGPAVTVDVMVAYTAQAAAAAGGQTAMLNQIRDAVAYSNQAYANTDLSFRINLVDTVEVTMTEDGTCGTPLNRLTFNNDGVIDEIHARRDQVGADLVVLMISRGDCGGLAWVMNNNSPTFATRGFSVVLSTSPGYWRNISFAHELGHNMGAAHDRRNSNVPGLFSYSYGYQSFEALPYFRDIMAYECSGGISCPTQDYFSSPEILRFNRPGGRPTNAFDSADVRSTFMNSITNVSNFRATQVPPTPTITLSPTTIPVPAGGATNVSIAITAAGAWSASASAAWITGLNPTSGSGNATLRFNVAANTLSEIRRGSILVNNATALVEQASGLTCSVTPIAVGATVDGILSGQSCISPIRGNTRAARYSFFGSQGQQIAISLTSPAFDTYLYLLQPNGTLAAENDDISFPGNLNSRIPVTGLLTLSSSGTYVIEVTSFEAAVTGTFTLALISPSCSFGITPNTLNVGALQSDATVAVTTAGGCAWTASSATSWISVTSNSASAGPGNVGLRVAANNTNAARNGTVTIAGQTLQVSQAAPSGCTVSNLPAGVAVNGALTAGQTCRSAFSGANYFAARYSFTGAAGQQVRIVMQSSSLDTYLYLVGPDGNVVAQDDDSGGGLNSAIPSLTGFLTLPTGGTYIVEATTFDQLAAGTFTLSLTVAGAGGGGDPQTLTSGVPRSIQLPAVQSPLLFNNSGSLLRLEVPANATRVEVRLSTAPVNVDADVYVRFGASPTVEDGLVVADHAGDGLTGEELITILPTSTPALRPGTYFLALAVFTPGIASTATVTATITTGGASGSGPAIGRVEHGASFRTGIVAGSWVTIFGENLAPAGVNRVWQGHEILNGVLPTNLEGTRVTIGGLPAAIYYISPGQLNVQAPSPLPNGPVLVQVITPAGTATGTAQVVDAAPELFRVGTSAYPWAQDATFALLGPPALVPGARLARRGEAIVLYATGLGPTNPPRPSGVVINPAALGSPLSLTIGGKPALVTFAGLISPGLYQINAVIPNDIGTGDQPIVVTVNGRSNGAALMIPVGN